jgi:hypothetical protein
MTISKSPDRGVFQEELALNAAINPDISEERRQNARDLLELYNKWRIDAEAQEMDKAWQENNLEYDLRTCEWILQKVRNSDTYAQNLYAALCNVDWMKCEVWNILKDQTWGCSWRHAGGIIADMRVRGDYIDWYCSGIGDGLGNGDADGTKGYVSEGTVTDEIANDIKQLGWIVKKITET